MMPRTITNVMSTGVGIMARRLLRDQLHVLEHVHRKRVARSRNSSGGRASSSASSGEKAKAPWGRLRRLYIALLLNLDARGVWRYDARRTNWEHIHALEKNTAHHALVAPLADITHRFDRVRYGNADCNRDDWDAFERDVTKVEAATS